MLQQYALNEFYADLISHRLELAKKWWDRIMFFTFAGLFLASWLGLIFRKEETSALLERFGGMFAQWIFEEPYTQQRMIGIFGAVFLLNLAPSLVSFDKSTGNVVR